MPNILTTLMAEHAGRTPGREALFYPAAEPGVWLPRTWRELADEVSAAAAAMAHLGLKEQQCILTFMANRTELLVADFAAYANRAIPVSVYATSSAEQLAYIVRDTGAQLLIVDDAARRDTALQIRSQCPTLHHIVVTACEAVEGTMTYDAFLALADDAARALVERRSAAATADDVATLIYTSGTTGEPKGAILPHSCFNACMEIHRERLTMLSEADTSVSFLPLSHIFERAWTYFCLYSDIKVWLNADPRRIQQTLLEVQPTCMCSVPRFWEKVYAGVREKIAGMGAMKRWLIARAVATGRRRNMMYVRRGLRTPLLLELRYRMYNALVFGALRRAVGISHGNIFPTAGAPLSPVITEFMRSVGIPVMIGYGLSETTATVTCFPQTGWEPASAGTAVPRVQVRISPEGEIQVKAPTVMRGYHNKAEATAEAFTADGWLHTGDVGYFDTSGALVITERIKDLYKTSNGKYIAPQAVEARLSEDPYIEQVAVIGDGRKYATALIVPDYNALRQWADEHDIAEDMPTLLGDPRIYAMMQERIATLQHSLARHEQVKHFRLLPQPLTMEAGELTNTLKIRRNVVNERYRHLIEEMYNDNPA